MTSKWKKISGFFIIILAVVLARAEQLPVKVFSSAEGLASSVIHHVARDSQGFLWFCARGGLSRFDGSEFTSYQIGDETSPLVHYFLETSDGTFWISTDKGIYRVRRSENADVKPIADELQSGVRRLNVKKVSGTSAVAMHEDRAGRLWIAGNFGVNLIENREADEITFSKVDFSPKSREEKRNAVRHFAESADGSLWLAALSGAMRLLPDGRWVEYRLPRIADYEEVFSVRFDKDGRAWFSHSTGIYVFQPETPTAFAAGENQIVRSLPIEEQEVGIVGAIKFPAADKMIRLKFKEEPESNNAGQAVDSAINDIYPTDDGKMWLPSAKSLYVFEGENYLRLQDTNSLPGRSQEITEDGQGNIWFGTFGGAVKFVRNGFVSYTQAGGLNEPLVHSIQETPDGKLFVVHGTWRVSILTAEGIQTARLNLPAENRFIWTALPTIQDKTGAVWSLTDKGLYRFSPFDSLPELERKSPQNISASNPSINKNLWYRAFSDNHGNIWFSTRLLPEKNYLFKYNLQSGEWTDLTETEGFPTKKSFASFAEDKAGNFWFGFYGENGLAKFSDGKFTLFAEADGLPKSSALSILTDRQGRLWISSTEDGISRIENPAAEKFEITRYTETEGLAHNNVRCLVEDLDGNIYAGTVRGVSRINAETGKIKNFTTADGLAADFVHSAFRDRKGAMWFGTANGLSKLEPKKEKDAPAPQIFISDLQIAGTNYSVSELGQREVGNIETSASENNLQVNFFSIGERSEIRYQYKLEGAAQADWRDLGEQRSVNFGNLSSGNYRLLVRAVNRGGIVSENPAVVSFRILSPVWARWWFIALCILAVSLIVYAIYRYRISNLQTINAALTEAKQAEENLRKSREERLAELEQVRTRIATDLHDDIGASLTQIAILSEVAQQQKNGGNAEPLTMISSVSNELVGTMSDIVWAINPTKDHLHDLTLRMRRFASDVLSAKDIDFEFEEPENLENISLNTNLRREVFLIFKESINNIVKHSEASEVEIEFKIDAQNLFLTVKDNGKGFDFENSDSSANLYADYKGGNGLLSMKRRAVEMGGEFEIASEKGKGTIVNLRLPVAIQLGGEFEPKSV